MKSFVVIEVEEVVIEVAAVATIIVIEVMAVLELRAPLTLFIGA